MSKINSKRAIPCSVSQNFLTSAKTINRLLRLTSISKYDHVVEIGSGKGHITKALVKVCKTVSSYEIDYKLYEKTKTLIGDNKNLNLWHKDFLKAPLPQNEAYKVFSNIPFSITSDIIRKLTDDSNPPEEAWLVMEKGAAKRFVGDPNETLASISLRPFFDIKVAYHFSRDEFHPMPSVDVVLLHLTKKGNPDLPLHEKKHFYRFIGDSLKYGITRNLTKRQIGTALKLAGLPCIQRSGTILYVQWLCLFRCCRQLHGG